jgi:hypothetical protein
MSARAINRRNPPQQQAPQRMRTTNYGALAPPQQPQPNYAQKSMRYPEQQPPPAQPQDGGIMTVEKAISLTTYRLTRLEQKVSLLEVNGLNSSSSSSNSSNSLIDTSSQIDETVINDILERINGIEEWIDNNNNVQAIGQQLQQLQNEFAKHIKLQNDKILKLETELKKKPAQQPPAFTQQRPQAQFQQQQQQQAQEIMSEQPPPRQYQQQPQEIQSEPAPIKPRNSARFGINKNVMPKYPQNVMDINIEETPTEYNETSHLIAAAE